VERASLARPWLAEEHHDAHPTCIRALCPDVFCNAQKSAVNVESTPIVSPANHGLASEARSTVSPIDARRLGEANRTHGSNPARLSLGDTKRHARRDFRPTASTLKLLLYLHVIISAKGIGCGGVEAVAFVGKWRVGIEDVVNTEG
jgi:hypothetical protein